MFTGFLEPIFTYLKCTPLASKRPYEIFHTPDPMFKPRYLNVLNGFSTFDTSGQIPEPFAQASARSQNCGLTPGLGHPNCRFLPFMNVIFGSSLGPS